MTCGAVYITGIGFIEENILNGTAVDGSRQSMTVDSMEKMRWSSHYERPCDSFRRMDLPCRYAVAAAEMVGLPPLPPGELRPDVAIVSGTRFGCYGVDAEFLQSMFRPEGASPMMFTYTLPNVPLGELAIRHGITGGNLCLQAGIESGLLALWESFRLIEHRESAACLCLVADAVPSAVAAPLKKHLGNQETAPGYARAFFMESQSHQRKTGHNRLAEIDRTSQAAEYRDKSSAETIMRDLCRFLTRESDEKQHVVIPSPKTLKEKGSLGLHRSASVQGFNFKK